MSNLATPAFLVGPDGALIFYNQAAADLLGTDFEELGPMSAQEWRSRFEPVTPDGGELALEDSPIALALVKRCAVHRGIRFRTATGEDRLIEVTAFPVVGHDGLSGAIAIFWSDQS